MVVVGGAVVVVGTVVVVVVGLVVAGVGEEAVVVVATVVVVTTSVVVVLLAVPAVGCVVVAVVAEDAVVVVEARDSLGSAAESGRAPHAPAIKPPTTNSAAPMCRIGAERRTLAVVSVLRPGFPTCPRRMGLTLLFEVKPGLIYPLAAATPAGSNSNIWSATATSLAREKT